MMPDTIRLSETAKRKLVQLRRRTGIDRWNVLCRWALCLSLRETSSPYADSEHKASNVEMTWKTFAGQYSGIITAILIAKHKEYLVDYSDVPEEKFFYLHLDRGISMLATRTDVASIGKLLELAVVD